MSLARRTIRAARPGRSGSVLALALLFIVALSGLAVAVIGFQAQAAQGRRAIQRQIALQYVAEAGLSEALTRVRAGGAAAIGSVDDPEDFGPGTRYCVEDFDLGSGAHRLVATGFDGQYQCSVEAVVVVPEGGFGFPRAITARDMVRLQSNVLVDSYDPVLGTYTAQLGHASHVGNEADIGTNGSVNVAANTKVYGAIAYGPDLTDSASVSGSAIVTGGQSQAHDYIEFPPIEVPALTSAGNLTVAAGTRVLGPGDVRYDALVVNNHTTLKIVGPARVVLDGFTLNGGATLDVDASGGKIEVYVANTFDLRSHSNVAIPASNASQVSFNLLAVHSAEFDSTPLVALNSNASFVGTIYAPEAHLIVDSNFQMYGGVAARWVQLRSNTRFHFDESLLRSQGAGGDEVEIVGWRPLSQTQAQRIRTDYVGP